MYHATKTYGHDAGFSCTFRQWRATSHCRFMHGYSLSFKFVFEALTLDENGWVIDFGSLKELKATLAHWFDHTTVVAEDDPELETFWQLDCKGLLQLRVLDIGVSCERFAKHAYNLATEWLRQQPSARSGAYGEAKRVRVLSVTVSEHGGNSATFEDT